MKKQNFDSLFVPTYKRDGAPIVKGKGSWLYDADDKKYLDFGSGIAVNALGHAHPALTSAIKKQAAKVIHSSNLYFSQAQIDLAAHLLKNSFGDKLFFCNSGTEANEAAIKFARKKASGTAGKYHVLSFTQGFHGRTYGALSATPQEKFHAGFKPLLEGFHCSELNDIKAAKKILDSHKFAAVIIEPLQGEGGVNPVSTEFLKFLREYTEKNSIALIFDEIQCGMGRTGTLWNYQQHKVVPDMMTLAKPIGGGLPLGVVICSENFSSALSPGDHGTTFGGNPVACALGYEVLKIVSAKPFLKEVQQKGSYLKKKLTVLKKEVSGIEDIRGAGLLIGVQMKEDPVTVVHECKSKGLLVVKAGRNTIRFMPPLTVSTSEIDKAVAIFKSVISKK